MAPRSPLDYDISVSADKRRRARARGNTGAVESSARRCEWPNCEATGQYRAPVSPEQLNVFRWFCLEHVREYNASWNYFSDLSDEEISARTNADRTWERPTWSMRSGTRRGGQHWPHAEGKAWARSGFRDVHDVLGENATMNPGMRNGGKRPVRRLLREEQRALDALGLEQDVESRTEIRTRYRELVKDLHPDMNDGGRADEARLAQVLRAWDILKKSRNFKD